jgi:hypothetical protein
VAARGLRRVCLGRRPQQFREVGQALATVGDEEPQQLPAAPGVNAAPLDATLSALGHQPGGKELRDMMGERRFGDADDGLNLADR